MSRVVKLPLSLAVLCVGMAMASTPLFAQPASAGTHRYPPLFGTGESVSSDLVPFPKWTGILERYFDEKKLEDVPCTTSTFNKCQLREWKAFLKTQEGKGLKAELKAVNDYMNAAGYILDPVNWGVPDYWTTPNQFFSRDGDCEDYAIAKFISLRALGVPNDRMRIVILQDLNLGVLHAVLAVYDGDTIYILDNQAQRVVEASDIRHYQPIYSINETAWWRHR